MHPGNIEKGDLQPIKDARFTGKEDLTSHLVDERNKKGFNCSKTT